MFARIPALLLEVMTKDEIAAMYGVTPGTLVVRCSQRGISLRRASQTAANRGETLGRDGLNNGPQGYAMQRLVGHQSKPVRSV